MEMEMTDEEIRDQLLIGAYDLRQRGFVPAAKIRRATSLEIRSKEVESHLFILCDRKLMQKKQETHTQKLELYGQKTQSYKTTSYQFRITNQGEEYVLSGCQQSLLKTAQTPTGISIQNSPGAQIMVSSPYGQQNIQQRTEEVQRLIQELYELIEEKLEGPEKTECKAVVEGLVEECLRDEPRKPIIDLFLSRFANIGTLAGVAMQIAQLFN